MISAGEFRKGITVEMDGHEGFSEFAIEAEGPDESQAALANLARVA
jgi:hypothetical protein